MFYDNRRPLLVLLIASMVHAYNFDQYNVAQYMPAQRVARSPVIMLCYMAEKNMGDYLPTLGMSQLLGFVPDMWDINDPDIDFDFINAHYRGVIIGGAGLLHRGFEEFYAQRLLKRCAVPWVVWGVGVCLPHGVADGVSPQVARALFTKASLVCVRDALTQGLYALAGATVMPCPSVVYVAPFKRYVDPRATTILYVAHTELVDHAITERHYQLLKSAGFRVKLITHRFATEKSRAEIARMIKNDYCASKVVVTTRLHGAIVAYALGIPYIAIPYDEKVVSFCATFGNGIIVDNDADLIAQLRKKNQIPLHAGAINRVVEFGARVRKWIAGLPQRSNK